MTSMNIVKRTGGPELHVQSLGVQHGAVTVVRCAAFPVFSVDHRVVDKCFQEKLSSFWERAAVFPVVDPFYSLAIGTEEKK